MDRSPAVRNARDREGHEIVRFDTFRESGAGRRPSLAGMEKLDCVLVQFQIEPVAIPQYLHRLRINFVKPILRGRAVFVRHGSRSAPTQFGTKETDGSSKLFADTHKIEGSQISLCGGQKGGFVNGIRRAVSSNGGQVMCIGILNDGWAVPKIVHEIRKWQLSCLGCYRVMLGRGPPEGMG